MDKLNISFKENALEFGVDLNNDGQNAIKGKLYLNEALQEIIKRQKAVENARVVSFRFEGTKLILELDTDKNGEKLFELIIDFLETFEEAPYLF